MKRWFGISIGIILQLSGVFVFAQDLPLTQPAQTQPAQTQPAQTQPAQTQPAQSQPAQTQPAQTQPALPQTRPALVQARPAENVRPRNPIVPTTDPALKPTTHPSTSSQKVKVVHSPQQPRSNEPVKIDVYPTKSIKTAVLQYQIVKPGAYVTFKDDAYNQNWSSLPMSVVGDHFSVTMPEQLQVHRNLVRYRVLLDKKIYPEKKDLVGNFAYFCYDGIGSWKGAIEPGSADEARAKVVEYDASVMNSVQPIFLIAKNKDVEDATWNLKDRSDRRWIGAIVYNGKVFDHIFFRNRGAGFRYALGKHQWKFFFDKDNPLTLIDDYGVPFAEPIDNMDLGACLQAPSSHGEQGMFEAATMKMFSLAGVPSPHTTWLQLRIIDDADEEGKTQFEGDLWGLYMAIENPDEHFVQQYDLPKGNLYKMDQSYGLIGAELKSKSPTLPSDNSDLVAFKNALGSNKPKGLLATILSGATQTPATWHRDNINLPKYYSYRAVVDVVQHHDLGQNRNCVYFHDPTDNLWYVIPWDAAFSWNVPTQNGAPEAFSMAFLDRPEFRLEYSNRLREVRDLLFYPEEMSRLFESLACVINTPDKPSFTEVDRALWDYNPVVSDKNKAPRGKAGTYYIKNNAGNFRGMIKNMNDFVAARATWIDSTLLKGQDPPRTPVIKYTGPTDYAKDALAFSCSAFESPSAVTFSAMQWRLARIDTDDPSIKRPNRVWEINPLWQSDEIKEFTENFTLPDAKLKPGETYRVRARIKDSNGVWSHWSDPVQWTAQ